jgi:hypothetical protein
VAKITKLGMRTCGKSGKSVMKNGIKTNKNQLKAKEGMRVADKAGKKNARKILAEILRLLSLHSLK